MPSIMGSKFCSAPARLFTVLVPGCSGEHHSRIPPVEPNKVHFHPIFPRTACPNGERRCTQATVCILTRGTMPQADDTPG